MPDFGWWVNVRNDPDPDPQQLYMPTCIGEPRKSVHNTPGLTCFALTTPTGPFKAGWLLPAKAGWLLPAAASMRARLC
jgi:hypothetical protein